MSKLKKIKENFSKRKQRKCWTRGQFESQFGTEAPIQRQPDNGDCTVN